MFKNSKKKSHVSSVRHTDDIFIVHLKAINYTVYLFSSLLIR